MTTRRRTVLQSLPGAGLAFGMPAVGRGQAASGEMRIVVGFPPGGPLDIAARMVAPALQARLGRAVRVENRVGASGNDATRDVVRAAPDGATLLLCGPVNTINTTLFPTLDFDFGRDIAAVAAIARVPLIVEVHPSVPVRSIPALIAHARDRPGQLRAAYAGIGTPQHIALALFQHMAGVRLSLVAHPGSAAALADLLGGAADLMFDPAPSSMPHVRAGRLVALATTGPARAPALPDLPTVGETLPGYEGGSWFGLGAPKDTPAEILAEVNAAVNASLQDTDILRGVAALGGSTMAGSVEDFARFVSAETARYAEIIRVAGITTG